MVHVLPGVHQQILWDIREIPKHPFSAPKVVYRTTNVAEETVKMAVWMGDWVGQSLHSLSASATDWVKSVKNMVLFLGHDNKRTGRLEGQ